MLEQNKEFGPAGENTLIAILKEFLLIWLLSLSFLVVRPNCDFEGPCRFWILYRGLFCRLRGFLGVFVFIYQKTALSGVTSEHPISTAVIFGSNFDVLKMSGFNSG